MAFQVSDRRVVYIQNKSENATPELFAIYMYMQNDASQKSKWKCIWMFKNWVMHKVKVYGYCYEETHERHLNVTGVHFFR